MPTLRVACLMGEKIKSPAKAYGNQRGLVIYLHWGGRGEQYFFFAHYFLEAS